MWFLAFLWTLYFGHHDAAPIYVGVKDPANSVTVELARTPKEQERGLMYRHELAQDHGMLFIFATEKERSFWMRHTYIPLDMIFTDQSGLIQKIFSDVPPCSDDVADEECPLYTAPATDYVLELAAGSNGRFDVHEGDRLFLPVLSPPSSVVK